MNSKYLLSYTAVSLKANEAETIANMYNKTLDWVDVEKQVLEENVLQKSTLATRKREFKPQKSHLS